MIDRLIGIMGFVVTLVLGLWSLAPEDWPKLPHWLFYSGMLVGCILIGVAIGLIIADRRNIKSPGGRLPPNWNEPLTMVSGQNYENETVPVDGRHFVRCAFKQVTFRFDGDRPAMFTECTRAELADQSFIKIYTANPVVSNTLTVADVAGLLRQGINNGIIDKNSR